ncbi:MAG: hypothetical protein CL942_08705 [Desulfovibrio sp.]|nr:hypothetical protein [Desulfovibrio sp.]|tara:strand:+ start:283 stop:573 length:291 start_codon:yes stop_codon:yes gene_type:complete
MNNAPRFKKDYPGKTVMLFRNAPEDRSNLFTEGATARVERRVKAEETKLGHWPLPGDGASWWLRLEIRCPHCNAHHQAFVPESWIEQGLIVFKVED